MQANSCAVIAFEDVLADTRQRAHLQQAGQWDDYWRAARDDRCVPALLRFIPPESVVMVSSAPEQYRHVLDEWFAAHAYIPAALLMRPAGNYMKDAQMKLFQLEQHFGSAALVLDGVRIVLESKDATVEAFRNYGLPTLQFSLAGLPMEQAP